MIVLGSRVRFSSKYVHARTIRQRSCEGGSAPLALPLCRRTVSNIVLFMRQSSKYVYIRTIFESSCEGANVRTIFESSCEGAG